MELSLPVYVPDKTYCGDINVFFDLGVLFHRFAGDVLEL